MKLWQKDYKLNKEIEKFTKDESVVGLIIDLGTVSAGFSKKQEMHKALKEFKDSGKEIIVYANHGITNRMVSIWICF